jgi:S-adenosylmethionine/arginine decarboxylase-like enzyme
MKKKIQHKHLLLRAEIQNPPKKSKANELMLNTKMEELIAAIGMKTVLPARCVYVGTEGNEGYTGQAGLETSHLAYHIWNKPDKKLTSTDNAGLLQMDIYTCGCLGKKERMIIRKLVDDMFGILKYEEVHFDRAKTILHLVRGT